MMQEVAPGVVVDSDLPTDQHGRPYKPMTAGLGAMEETSDLDVVLAEVLELHAQLDRIESMFTKATDILNAIAEGGLPALMKGLKK